MTLPPEQLHHVSCSVQGKVGVRHVQSLRKSSFNFCFVDHLFLETLTWTTPLLSITNMAL